MDPQSASSQASSQEVSGLQSLVQGGMGSLGKPTTPAPAGPPLSGDAANLQSFLNSPEAPLPMPTKRPSSSEEFNAAQYAGGYSEPAEKSGRPVTYLMQKPDESYEDFMKRGAAHGKTVTQQQISDEANQPMKMAVGVPARVAETTTGTFGSLAAAAEAINAGGPAAHKALQWVVNFAKNNKTGTALGLIWALNQGLEAAGLPKASRLVEKMELPAILLLGASKAGAESATGAEAAAASGESAAAAETSAAAPAAAAPAAVAEEASAVKPAAVAKESAEDFVNRQTNGRAQVKPNAEGQAVDSETGEPVSEPDAWDKLPKEEQQRRMDNYYAQHPQQKPKPQSWQRGPKKGQPKMTRVFDEGKWHEVPVYK